MSPECINPNTRPRPNFSSLLAPQLQQFTRTPFREFDHGENRIYLGIAAQGSIVMADAWFYSLNNERKGPVDLATLKLLISTRAVSCTSLVWKKGMPGWQPAEAIAELLQAANAPVPAEVPLPPRPPATTPKKSIRPWVIGGAAVLAVLCALVVVLVVVLAASSYGSSSTGEPADSESRYDEQLNKDAQEVRDAFRPYQGK
jgi:hypothetical protein